MLIMGLAHVRDQVGRQMAEAVLRLGSTYAAFLSQSPFDDASAQALRRCEASEKRPAEALGHSLVEAGGTEGNTAPRRVERVGVLGGHECFHLITRRIEVISSKVFVGNLNYATTSAELSAFLEDAGQIIEVFLPSDRATGRPRGFAFVEFATEDEAREAIERFDGSELGGRKLRINPADSRPPRPSRAPQGMDLPPMNDGRGKPKGSRRRIRSRKRSL